MVAGGLFEAIDSIPQERPIFLLIAQLNHLGNDDDDICWFLNAIYEINPNVIIWSMSEFGLDLYEVAEAILFYHGTRRTIRRAQFDATKNVLEVDGKAREIQEKIDSKVDSLMKHWNGELTEELRAQGSCHQ